MKTISFKVSKFEFLLINKIAKRASAMAKQYGIEYPVLTADMDITACHTMGNPMDLSALAGFDDSNFAHDVFGIRRHINRTTGQLQDCFVPRCSI